MPRVGSSRMSTLGRAASQRASTTFCWLPPESLPTSWSREGVRTLSRSTYSAPMRRSARRCTIRKRVSRRRMARVAFSRTLRMSTRPSRLRSSGAKPMPCAMAALGECRSSSWPSTRTAPGGLGQLAEDDLGQLGATGAHEPGEAHDLAGMDLERDAPVPVADGCRGPRSTTRSVADGRRWKTSPRSRPTMLRTISSSVRPAASRDRHEAPVAQDGHAVGQPQDLVQAVAHVDDGHALRAQPPHEREEALDLLVGQRGGRLVEGQDAHP